MRRAVSGNGRRAASAFANVRPIAFALAALLLIAPVPASAGTISIVLQTRIVAGPGTLRVELDVRNQGDEAALNVVPAVEFQGRVVQGAPVDVLGPALSTTSTFDVPLPDGTPRGVWPLLVRVRYSDGGGHPFEAIHADLARFSDVAATTGFGIEVPDERVATETRVRVRVDRGEVAGPVRLAFVAPAGVVVTPAVVTLVPGADAAVTVTVAAAGATIASRLPLIAIAEYDAGDGHHAVTAVSTIEIGAPAVGGSRGSVIAVLLAATVLGWLVLAIVSARRRRRSQ